MTIKLHDLKPAPGSKTAKLVMVFEQQHLVPAVREPVGGRQTPKSGTDDDDVVGVGNVRKRYGHWSFWLIVVE